jgi:hypothetical protein
MTFNVASDREEFQRGREKFQRERQDDLVGPLC